MYQAHKKIDTELAGRAREMLKTMVDSGGDLDLEAVKAIVNEAQRRYDEADAEVVKAEGTLDGAPDETTFFKVEPKEAGNELPLATDDDVTETTAKVVKPVAQKFVPPELPELVPQEVERHVPWPGTKRACCAFRRYVAARKRSGKCGKGKAHAAAPRSREYGRREYSEATKD